MRDTSRVGDQSGFNHKECEAHWSEVLFGPPGSPSGVPGVCSGWAWSGHLDRLGAGRGGWWGGVCLKEVPASVHNPGLAYHRPVLICAKRQPVLATR